MKKNGFTLIELLVVIVIIAILATLLLPSLTKAQQLARKTACLSNLKGLGTSWGLYLNDFDQRFPDTSNWWGWGGANFGTLVGSAVPIANRALYEYVESEGLYKCPADNNGNAVSGIRFGNVWADYGSSYAINQWISRPSAYKGPLSDFDAAGKTILIGETTMYLATSSGWGGWPGWNGNYTWHSNEGMYSNILFADMHASFVDVYTRYNATQNYGPDHRWLPIDNR